LTEKDNWAKRGVGVTIVVALAYWFYTILYEMQDITEAQRYFLLTLIIFVGFFLYFQWFKE
jgi:hypothetical protein